MKTRSKQIGWIFIYMLTLVSACKKDEDLQQVPSEPGNYMITVYPEGAANPLLHITGELTSGSLSVVNAFEHEMAASERQFIDGFLYAGNRQTGKFTKSEYVNGSFVERGSVSLTAGSYRINKLGENKIIVLINSYFKDGKVPYYVLNTADFSITSSGTLNIPIPANTMVWPTSALTKDGKVLLNHLVCNQTTYGSLDTAYVSVFNPNTLAYEKTTKDTRTCALGFNNLEDHFMDAAGDLYISTCNTDFWGINEKLPAGILRIRAGQTDFDRDYFFNVSSAIGGNHYIGLHPVGNGKAIIRAYRKDLITSYNDYRAAHVVEHYIADVATRTATKLDIPLSVEARQQIAVLGDGKYAIPANTKEGSFFYIYDAATGTVKKGAHYTDAVLQGVTGLQ